MNFGGRQTFSLYRALMASMAIRTLETGLIESDEVKWGHKDGALIP